MHSDAHLGDNSETLKLATLFIPLLFVPIVIFLAIPNVMMSTYLEGWLISVAEIVGVFASIWVIKD